MFICYKCGNITTEYIKHREHSCDTNSRDKCEVCARLKAWDTEGKASEKGMAVFFLEKLIEAEKRYKSLLKVMEKCL